MLDKNTKIYIAGHRGLVGSAIWKNPENRGYHNLVGRTHAELDLADQRAVEEFFKAERPEAVVLAAAFVGGIMANSLYRADFIMQNLKMQCNVIDCAYRYKVKKLLFLGSTCIYPKNAPQPMGEDALLTSPLEYTNEEYAIAKIAGLKMCESYNLQYGTNYIAVMPTNLYGPNDNFHLENSHVLPAMMRKFYRPNACTRTTGRPCATTWRSGLSTRPPRLPRRSARATWEDRIRRIASSPPSSFFGIEANRVTLGATERRCASFCGARTWPTPASISCSTSISRTSLA